MPSSLYFSYLKFFGGLAQLARAPALQAGGRGFESVYRLQLPDSLVGLEILNAICWWQIVQPVRELVVTLVCRVRLPAPTTG